MIQTYLIAKYKLNYKTFLQHYYENKSPETNTIISFIDRSLQTKSLQTKTLKLNLQTKNTQTNALIFTID